MSSTRNWFEQIEAKRAQKEKNASRYAEYIATIIANFVFLYIVNNLSGWVNWLEHGWFAVLWILNISLIASIIVNFAYLFYDRRWFKSLMQLALNVISLVFMYSFFVIFPIDLAQTSVSWLEVLIRIATVVGIIAIIIGIVVEFVRFSFYVASRK